MNNLPPIQPGQRVGLSGTMNDGDPGLICLTCSHWMTRCRYSRHEMYQCPRCDITADCGRWADGLTIELREALTRQMVFVL